MKIIRINNNLNFKGNEPNKRNKLNVMDNVIDCIEKSVKNPKDINDCVAVPRGIFKAYISLMTGTGLMAIANLLPQKATGIKKGVNLIGWGLNILSAYYFAKPFAFKGNVPTVTKENQQ